MLSAFNFGLMTLLFPQQQLMTLQKGLQLEFPLLDTATDYCYCSSNYFKMILYQFLSFLPHYVFY